MYFDLYSLGGDECFLVFFFLILNCVKLFMWQQWFNKFLMFHYVKKYKNVYL